MVDYKKMYRVDIAWGLIITALFSILFVFTSADLYLQGLFFESSAEDHWPHRNYPLFHFLYHYGVYPAAIVGGLAIAALIISFFRASMRRVRWPAIFLVFVIVLGPGLIINSFLKMSAGHPRPRETTEFAGKWEYQKLYTIGEIGRGRSFPCGHCSMGFFFVSFYFLTRTHRHRFAWLAGGLLYGLLVGMARTSAGAHFPADVFFSGVVVYFTALFLYYKILRLPEKQNEQREWSVRSRVVASVASLVLFTGVAVGVSLATPYYSETEKEFHAQSGVEIECEQCSVLLAEGDKSLIDIKSQGFGMPGSKVKVETAGSKVRIYRRGTFTELSVDLSVHLSKPFPPSVLLRGADSVDFAESLRGKYSTDKQGSAMLLRRLP